MWSCLPGSSTRRKEELQVPGDWGGLEGDGGDHNVSPTRRQ
jgi:hypothetical protein